MGRPPIGDKPISNAERQRRWRVSKTVTKLCAPVTKLDRLRGEARRLDAKKHGGSRWWLNEETGQVVEEIGEVSQGYKRFHSLESENPA